jgi:hypothetical protein
MNPITEELQSKPTASQHERSAGNYLSGLDILHIIGQNRSSAVLTVRGRFDEAHLRVENGIIVRITTPDGFLSSPNHDSLGQLLTTPGVNIHIAPIPVETPNPPPLNLPAAAAAIQLAQAKDLGMLGNADEDEEYHGDIILINMETGVQLMIKRLSNVLGRLPNCHIVVDDPSISGSHCLITVREPNILVEDMGSTNGTYLDGKLVLNALAEPGSVIHIGKTRLKVHSRSSSRLAVY